MGRASRARRQAKTQQHGGGNLGEHMPGASGRGSSFAPGAPPRHGSAAPHDDELGARTAQDNVDALINWALGALDCKDQAAAEEFTTVLAATLGSHGRTVEDTLVKALSRAVADAWQRGWQPADLHRLAARRFGAETAQVMLDAVVADLLRFAPATVDPRWADQLSELQATQWWPAHRSYLAARLQRPGGAVLQLPLAVQTLHVLRSAPKIERLGALPGEARPHATGAAAQVDERILARVRALLAKAESTNYPAEAETFTAGAQSLMTRHSIDLALVAASGPADRAQPGGRRIGIDNPYEAPKASLLTAVGDANRCRVVWSRQLGFCTVVGHDVDLAATETVFTSLLVQAVRAMTQEGARVDHYGRSRTRAFRTSFLTAYAHRIGERLREASEEQTTKAAAEHGVAGSLLPVLAARQQKVDAAFDQMFPLVHRQRARSVSDAEGWHRGIGAADSAVLGAGGQLSGHRSP